MYDFITIGSATQDVFVQSDVASIVSVSQISKKSEFILYTPLLKKVIENAIIDSKENNNGEVTPTHLFASLLDVGEGIAIRIFIGMNLDLDEIYDEFKQSIDPTTIQYDKVCETILDELEKAAKREGYLDEGVEKQIAGLRESLRHDLDRDLDTQREQICEYLAPELLRRYYYNRGAIIYSLRFDPEITRAAQLFGNPEEYKSILSAPKK